MAEGTRTNTLAIVSMVAGIVGWVAIPLLAHIVAVVTGHMARGQIRGSAGAEDGDAFALIGLVLGYLGLIGGCIVALLVVLVFGGLAAFLGAVGLAGAG
jgi:hypothetical protein